MQYTPQQLLEPVMNMLQFVHFPGSISLKKLKNNVTLFCAPETRRKYNHFSSTTDH
jgi:hypothetical protein